MKNTMPKQLATRLKEANKQLSEFTPKQKSALEKSWDIEHAYYSSTLEGSRIKRKEFEELARKVK